MRRRLFIFFFAMVLTLSLIRLAQALPYEFDLESGSWINTNGTNDALQLYAVVNIRNVNRGLQENTSKK